MGENILRTYGNNRMDQAAEFRLAYLQGRKLMEEQDRWCALGEENTTPFPEDFKYEMLADVIRGKVLVNTHSYTVADYDAFVRLTNEFKWHPAVMHHAHEAYLSTHILDKAYGGKPALAIFATNARYKQESYLGSPYAPYILTESGYDVIFKSDHPVLNSRELVYEAQQSIQYGLNASTALKAVTVTPANKLGLGHRIGHLGKGYDADVVVWDQHPLQLGATPVQTYIDGVAQLDKPFVIEKPKELQEAPKTVDVREKAEETMKYRGDPPLNGGVKAKNIVFQGVNSLYLRNDAGENVQEVKLVKEGEILASEDARVVITDGEISCVGSDCVQSSDLDFKLVDLKGGSITTGFTSYGSSLGVKEIEPEKSTNDGPSPESLTESSPLLGGLVVYAKDGLIFQGKNQLIAHNAGVTKAVVAPSSSDLFHGVSVSYSTSGNTSLDGIIDEVAAVHIGLGQSYKLGTSTHIGVLRALLSGEYADKTELTRLFKKVAKGEHRLVVAVDKADIMASLIRLKEEFPGVKMTFEGGHEAWLIADEIAKADIGVIINSRSFPGSWDTRRILPGIPLSPQSLPTYLTEKGITVALGIVEPWQALNTRLDAAWTYLNSNGSFSKSSALDLISTNLDKLLGLEKKTGLRAKRESWVAWEGDVFSIEGKARAVRAEGQAYVDIF